MSSCQLLFGTGESSCLACNWPGDSIFCCRSSTHFLWVISMSLRTMHFPLSVKVLVSAGSSKISWGFLLFHFGPYKRRGNAVKNRWCFTSESETMVELKTMTLISLFRSTAIMAWAVVHVWQLFHSSNGHICFSSLLSAVTKSICNDLGDIFVCFARHITFGTSSFVIVTVYALLFLLRSSGTSFMASSSTCLEL